MPRIDGATMKTLALDLGTKTGWAFVSEFGTRHTGSWDFSLNRSDSPAMRFIRFENQLHKLRFEFAYEHVVYERVDFAKTTIAAQIWGGFHALLLTHCEKNDIHFEGFGVTELKKFAAGKGNAKKPEMIAAAKRMGWTPTDDNSADACCLWEFWKQL